MEICKCGICFTCRWRCKKCNSTRRAFKDLCKRCNKIYNPKYKEYKYIPPNRAVNVYARIIDEFEGLLFELI